MSVVDGVKSVMNKRKMPNAFDLTLANIDASQADSPLHDLTDRSKVDMHSETDDEEITRILNVHSLTWAMERIGIDINDFITKLIDKKFTYRISNKRLGRMEMIEGVRGHQSEDNGYIDFQKAIKANMKK